MADTTESRTDGDTSAPAGTTGPMPTAPPSNYPSWPPPAYPGYSPRPSAPEQPSGPRRRWPLLAAVAATGIAIGAVAATIVTTQTGDTTTATVTTTVTETAAPPSPTAPPPQPEATANRQTCNAWLSAGERIDIADAELAILPSGVKVLDPAVRANPQWSAAVKNAAGEYQKASDILAKGITPGATPILDQAAQAAVAALRVLSTSYGAFDPAAGNTYFTWKESADTVDVLCERFAPR